MTRKHQNGKLNDKPKSQIICETNPKESNHMCSIHLHNTDDGGQAMREEMRDIKINM